MLSPLHLLKKVPQLPHS